jgi:hypothetical protein
MKAAFFCFLLISAGFAVGWVLGATITARQIAEAIRIGALSVEQNIDHLANQIESGQYKPVR